MKQSAKGRGLFTPAFIDLFIVSVLNNLSFNAITPILAKYAATRFDASLALAGALSGLFAVTSLLVRPFSGVLADRMSRKILLMISNSLIFIAVLGYALSTDIALLFFFRVLHGVGFALNGTANTAMISDFAPENRIGEAISLFSMAYLLTSSVGPAIGTAIGEAYGYRAVFVAAAASVGLSVALIVPLRPQNGGAPREKRVFAWKNLLEWRSLPYAAAAGCFSVVNGVISSFLILYADSIGVTGIAYYFTVKAAALILIRLALSRVIDRVRLPLLVYPALALGVVTAVLLSVGRSLPVFFAAAVCYALAAGVGQPALQTHIIKSNPPERRGVAVSTYYIGADTGQGVGSPLGGAVSDAFGYSAMYAASSLVFVLGAVLFAAARRTERRAKAKSTEQRSA